MGVASFYPLNLLKESGWERRGEMCREVWIGLGRRGDENQVGPLGG